MITATPSTCQPTEMLLNIATSGEEKMLISEWIVRKSSEQDEGLDAGRAGRRRS